jgi:hypothetical protein
VCTDSAVGSLGAVGAPEAEIEVTPKMIDAGINAFLDNWDDYPEVPGPRYVQEYLLTKTFLAMIRAR